MADGSQYHVPYYLYTMFWWMEGNNKLKKIFFVNWNQVKDNWITWWAYISTTDNPEVLLTQVTDWGKN